MSLLSLLRRPAPQRPVWAGTWARIWLRPGIFSPQAFIVGAAVFDDEGLCDFRFLTNTHKFDCVYGETGRRQVDALLDAARTMLGHARAQHRPVHQGELPLTFRLEPVGYASGHTPADALVSAMDPAEMPMESLLDGSIKADRFPSRAAAEVTAAIIDAIRLKAGADAERFLRDDSYGDEEHSARVNLVLPHQAGIIASGWYASPERVQLELLSAVTTVEGYSVERRKEMAPAVFFLRPTHSSGLRSDQAEAIDVSLDKLDWKLKAKGLRVSTRDNESDLADDVLQWAKP